MQPAKLTPEKYESWRNVSDWCAQATIAAVAGYVSGSDAETHRCRRKAANEPHHSAHHLRLFHSRLHEQLVPI
jgi:hypothetical protein